MSSSPFSIDVDGIDEDIDINDDKPFSFSLPTRKIDMSHDNILFNKSNISPDIVSVASSSSSSNSDDVGYNRNNRSGSNGYRSNQEPGAFRQEPRMNNDNNDRFRNDDRENNLGGGGGVVDEIGEKREILYQFDRLRNKGHNIPYSFTMQSDLNEMRSAYDRLKREKETDASVRFQRKMMLGFVTGFEYLNTRYDPFSIELEGWSEQVHENIDDYDDIFEELHDKYKATGNDMAPELRLMISLGGSAFMFHLTKRMFSNSKIPNVEEVLRNNPDLMKQFQNASATQYMANMGMGGGMGGMGGNPQQQPTSQQQMPPPPQPPSNDIFGMVSGLFGNDGGDTLNDVDAIISNVHTNINSVPDDQYHLEQLTVTDEEINSIIDDTADINLLSEKPKKQRKSKKKVLDL